MISQEQLTEHRVPERAPTRSRALIVGLVVLALALGGIAGWLANDQLESTGLPSDAETVIADYLDAFATGDEATIRALATDDYVIGERIYGLMPGLEREVLVETVDETMEAVNFDQEWETMTSGDPVVVGDGPWFVSYAETWIQDRAHYEGVATYVIVEEDGVTKIANHFWMGLRWYEAL